ncbi:hypothetical protein PMAYCL1PPCAC_31530 [Pristionchus mayeri]|uniref:G protein-coupled receptor n=1 Tax=Pristionchus mayeri TaxID=1317129 RepID=A0AAN5IEQ1_9BILA|nr:hypothetical protein PMAYCL1PPCAC_31529 [Pristionchus mayeri]GMR61335.1 hypothetical protein PMAYCL1PPCAC_31530 [Pristionchus mayeri]
MGYLLLGRYRSIKRGFFWYMEVKRKSAYAQELIKMVLGVAHGIVRVSPHSLLGGTRLLTLLSILLLCSCICCILYFLIHRGRTSRRSRTSRLARKEAKCHQYSSQLAPLSRETGRDDVLLTSRLCK